MAEIHREKEHVCVPGVFGEGAGKRNFHGQKSTCKGPEAVILAFKKKSLLIYLKGRVRKGQTNLPSAGSLLKWLWWLGLGQANARNFQVSYMSARAQTLGSSSALPGSSSVSWIDNGAC